MVAQCLSSSAAAWSVGDDADDDDDDDDDGDSDGDDDDELVTIVIFGVTTQSIVPLTLKYPYIGIPPFGFR